MGAAPSPSGDAACAGDRLGHRRGPRPLSSRDDLLAAAIEVFAETGYEGANLRTIERRAGLGRGLVAHHFGTKDQLWRTAMAWLMDRFHDELAQHGEDLGALDGRQRSRLLIGVFVRFHSRYPTFTRLLVVSGSDPSDRTKWLVEEYCRRNVAFYERMVGQSPRWSGSEAAMGYYLFAGAATLVFTVSAECRAVFGVDPTDPAFVEALADVLATLFDLHQTVDTPQGSLTDLLRSAATRHRLDQLA